MAILDIRHVLVQYQSGNYTYKNCTRNKPAMHIKPCIRLSACIRLAQKESQSREKRYRRKNKNSDLSDVYISSGKDKFAVVQHERC